MLRNSPTLILLVILFQTLSSLASLVFEEPATFDSKACCSRPPVILRGGYDYSPLGEYVPFNGTSTYVSGTPDATRGILMIYDIFGIFTQTVRGADILASGYDPAPDKAGTYKVFMPDFFGDSAANILDYPPKTPRQNATINAYLAGTGDPLKYGSRVTPILNAIKKAHPEIKTWGMFGTCWGAKITALNSQAGTQFKAAAQAHPSLLDIEDAKKIAIPMIILPSLDEEPQIIDNYVTIVKKLSPWSYNETFSDMPHGWMSSRADFEKLRPFEEYIRGYKLLRSFFARFL